MKLATVILAAGKGKRMLNPEKSKVMSELVGKPMIEYVIELALSLNSHKIVLIVGHQKQAVIDFISSRFSEHKDRISFAHQDEQLGTGHAVMQTFPYIKDFDGEVIILSGDVPLLRHSTVNKFIEYHRNGNFDATLLSAVFGEPFGYGRIIRNSAGSFIDIVEEKDASEEQKKINEINSGIYIIKNKYLFEGLDSLDKNNSQGEYYLTDVFNHFKKENLKIGADPVDDNYEITGINTIDQLNEMEQIILKSIK